MVSKWMASEARPALYRNILINDAETLVFLYRTFLEKPQLGKLVKRMSLDICEPDEPPPADGSRIRRRVTTGMPPEVDLEPLLSHAQHGFADHLTMVYTRRGTPYDNIAVRPALEKLYTLQFRVLSRTSELESLDWNLHPQSRKDDTHMYLHAIYTEAVHRVLRSLWNETSPCLSRLKELQLIGKEYNCAVWGRRADFAALICRCFLTLPRLQQIDWFNHAHSWLDAFSRLLMCGEP